MPLIAKSIPPATAAPLGELFLRLIQDGQVTLFQAPPGYLSSEGLATALAQREQPMLWLHIDRDDSDPATLLMNLILAAQRLIPDAGAATLELLRHRPGPIFGWQPLYVHLAAELSSQLPPNSAVVIEHAHALSDSPRTLHLLCDDLLGALASSLTCVLITSQELPREIVSMPMARRGRRELLLSADAARRLAEQLGANLPTTTLQRAAVISQGRAAALAALCLAGKWLGARLVQDLVARAAHADDLMVRIARALLADDDGDELEAIALALRLEYSHPSMVAATIGGSISLREPWFQPLDNGWVHLRPAWRSTLPHAFNFRSRLRKEVLARAAGYLVEQGAVARAVQCNFELGRSADAAALIASVADNMLDLGQWSTLASWLDQLPESELRMSPRLLYVKGKLAAGEGRIGRARGHFATTTELFTAYDDPAGACLSLLAESALAAWQGDAAEAWEAARSAMAMAERAGLMRHRGWAAWQLGCLTAMADALDDALIYFGDALSAATASADEVLTELLHIADGLIRQQRDLREQCELHRQLYYSAEQAERDTSERLRLLFNAPLAAIEVNRAAYRLSTAPLMLAIVPPTSTSATSEPSPRRKIWSLLAGAFGQQRRLPAEQAAPVPAPPRPVALELVAEAVGDAGATVLAASAAPLQTTIRVEPQPAHSTRRMGKAEASTPTLHVHMLGQFRVLLDDNQITSWPSGRGRSVFKYLVMNRQAPVSRDVLMDVFWPEAAPEAARNNLNVAIYGLRQAFQRYTHQAVVVYLRREGAYMLNPELPLWLDVVEFEREIELAHQLETAGQFARAAIHYESALSLHEGDFLAEDLYEEWTVIERERRRLAYLVVLDRLGQIYLNQGKYASCAALCQLMLTRDSCREDAHYRLMQCYSRQGQRHLALRQYKLCAEALRQELGVEPAQSTRQLYEQILHHEKV